MSSASTPSPARDASQAPEASPARGILYLAVGIAGVSTAALWVRLSGATGLELAFRRLAFALPFLVLWARVTGAPIRVLTFSPRSGSGPIAGLLVGLAAVLLALHFWCWNASLSRLPVAISLILVSLHPVLVLAVEWGRGRVRPGGLGILGMAAALGGTAWLVFSGQSDGAGGPGDGGSGRGGEGAGGAAGSLDASLAGSFDGSLAGSLLALAGAAALAGYLLAGRAGTLRAGRDYLPVPTYLIQVYGGAALVLAIAIALLPGERLLPDSGREWLWALLLAALPTLLGHTPLNAALRHLPATAVSTAFLGEVVGATLLAWWVLGEAPPPRFLVTGPLIALGIACVVWGARPRRVQK